MTLKMITYIFWASVGIKNVMVLYVIKFFLFKNNYVIHQRRQLRFTFKIKTKLKSF